MDPARSPGAQLPQRQRFMEFVQTASTCDALCQRENAALRAQVHDLSELLAAFDLCEIEDAHLSAVRDRAFSRDITPDAELLQVYRVERQLQQAAVLNDLEQPSAASEQDESSSNAESVGGSLQLRVEILELEVANLHLRHDLLLETEPRLKTPAAVEEVEGHSDTMKTIQEHQQRITELETALATEQVRNAELEQQNRRYHEAEKILAEYSQSR
ncbi:hypothetical protein L914_05524 [Phytophthora nicotianae]|uniref:Uncharacterized protein n=3 Tax=Phytophthora nicotianae TaxID=4792 RepID=V9FJ63_PHYNI|nr:hypothetical protein F443_05712 [Phytophthora nicotianae P1569]ETM50456.1 hypothetical protein L914_05524 [Phytophthora nicotianae]ETO79574.1 hypothetical protein F444_05763 [Phytophthora nicotianae P1976]